MAWQLVLDVMHHAPRDLTTGEKSVLMAIAEAVRHGAVSTRRARVSHGEIAWKANMTINSVPNVITRLVEKGALVRVPVDTDRRGRPVYTHRGTVPIYVVPAFKGDPDECPCADHYTARRDEGSTVVEPSDADDDADDDAEGSTREPEGSTRSPEGSTVVEPLRVSPGTSPGVPTSSGSSADERSIPPMAGPTSAGRPTEQTTNGYSNNPEIVSLVKGLITDYWVNADYSYRPDVPPDYLAEEIERRLDGMGFAARLDVLTERICNGDRIFSVVGLPITGGG